MDGPGFEPDIAIDAPLAVGLVRCTPAAPRLTASIALEVIRTAALPRIVDFELLWGGNVHGEPAFAAAGEFQPAVPQLSLGF